MHPPALPPTPLLAAILVPLAACAARASEPAPAPTTVPAAEPVRSPAEGMPARIARFDADWGALSRFHDVQSSPRRRQALVEFLRAQRTGLERLDDASLDAEGRLDWLLLRTEIESRERDLALRAERDAGIADLVPFADGIATLQEARQSRLPLDARAAAETLVALRGQVEAARKRAREKDTQPSKVLARRAAGVTGELRGTLREWSRFYQGYDPLFDWWCGEPLGKLQGELEGYEKELREEIVGEKEGSDPPIVGDPVGRAALEADLRLAWIPYSPEELIQIAEREWAWCQKELLRATAEMGLGEDWRAAMERVKQAHVAPGEQPALIEALAEDAIGFLEARDLLTVPPLAKTTWRMDMLSPEAQLESPFFLGGEEILVSFPTAGMAHDKKLMSMRGNNRHFAHATVFHELIPGHHLQQFMTQRHAPWRRTFSTPFWTEGWALYWETRMWDLGYQETPEDRIGALFWRMHRCARIRFSLGFHLGQLTPDQCVAMLVDEVGHEKENAVAEVRRSFSGGYGPLYQCAYMIGALQFRALHKELVESGKMSERAFHDAVLQGGNIPVELVRARLTGEIPARDAGPSWRFYDL